MKKIVLALVAASVLAAPVAAAPYRNQGHAQQVKTVKTVKHTRDGRTVVKTRQVIKADGHNQSRRWARGQRFDSRYAHNYRVINSPRAYRLYDAPRGYRWVQSGNDAVLVSIAGSLIAAVLSGAIG